MHLHSSSFESDSEMFQRDSILETVEKLYSFMIDLQDEILSISLRYKIFMFSIYIAAF